MILWEEIDPAEIQEKLKGKAIELVKRFQGYGLVHYNMRTEITPQTQQVEYEQEDEATDEVEDEQIQPRQPEPRPQQRPPPQQPPQQPRQQQRPKPIDPDEVQPQEPDINEDEVEDEM